MSAVVTLLEDILATAALRNAEAVTCALQLLRPPPHACSYARHLPIYRRAKIDLGRIWRDDGHLSLRQHANPWRDKSTQRLRATTEDNLIHLLEVSRAAMYEAPCGVCPACKTRRKPWPLQTLPTPAHLPVHHMPTSRRRFEIELAARQRLSANAL